MTTDRLPDARDEEGYAERREQAELERADREHDRRQDDAVEPPEHTVCRCIRCGDELPQPVTMFVCPPCSKKWGDKPLQRLTP